MIRASSSRSIGLLMKSSMPACRQRVRSLSIALAVSAMMGVRCRGSSRARIARVAMNPSIFGIWQSISTRS